MVDGQLNKKIGFVIQARLKSTRLPGKVLMPIPLDAEKCILERIIESIYRISDFDYDIIVATSKNKENDLIESFCMSNDLSCFRGDEEDVLSRFVEISESEQFDTIIRLTGDNPIVDTKILTQEIIGHINGNYDYTYTKGLPLGMNFEIINSSCFKDLKRMKLSISEKEHVTLYFRNNPDRFKIHLSEVEIGGNFENLRTTIDYPSDFLTVSAIIAIGLKYEVNGVDLIKLCYKDFSWIFDGNINNIQKRQ